MKVLTNFNFFASTVHTSNTITVVPVINIQWPAKADAVFYLKNRYNLSEEGESIDWTRTVEYLLPLHNEFCVNRLLKNLPQSFEEKVRGNAKVLSVDLFDPATHALIGTASVV